MPSPARRTVSVKRSRLDPYQEELVDWVGQGLTFREMARRLLKRGVRISHVAISTYVRAMLAPTLNRISERAHASLDEAVIEAIVAGLPDDDLGRRVREALTSTAPIGATAALCTCGNLLLPGRPHRCVPAR